MIYLLVYQYPRICAKSNVNNSGLLFNDLYLILFFADVLHIRHIFIVISYFCLLALTLFFNYICYFYLLICFNRFLNGRTHINFQSRLILYLLTCFIRLFHTNAKTYYQCYSSVSFADVLNWFVLASRLSSGIFHCMVMCRLLVDMFYGPTKICF